MPALSKPTGLTLCTYQVGFGDCFLLTFHYPRKVDKHVLIDFGTTGTPKKNDKEQLLLVAKDIGDRCKGKLTAVVCTHRHRDHLAGFSTEGKESPGKIIAALKPDVVIQPWTERPDADTGSTGLGSVGARSFVKSLASMQRFSQNALDEARALGIEDGGKLSFIGEDNLPNLSAVKNLMGMGPSAYVHFGSASGLEQLLPGVSVRVLGPPTIDQHPAVRNQRSSNPDEFWQLHADFWRLQADASGGSGAFPQAGFKGTKPSGKIPVEARWFVRRARDMRHEMLLGLVRSMDEALNNTSVILLIETGGKRLLFPGDAQIENWEYCLGKTETRELLKKVDVYKVGHHGSRNATPKSLWNLFEKRATSGKTRLKTFLSTMPDKHGSVEAHTEVPRKTLVDELQRLSDCYSTEHMSDPDQLCQVTSL